MRKAAIVLAALSASIVIAQPRIERDRGILPAAGLVTDVMPDSLTIWTDGEEAPFKYIFTESLDQQSLRGVVAMNRVRISYVKSDQNRRLMTVKKDPLGGGETAVGQVALVGEKWVVVKRAAAPLDGYVLPADSDELATKLSSLQKGDAVRIGFHNDAALHRIDTLEVLPRKSAATQPTTAADALAATSQPAVGQGPAIAKLKLAQMYLDNGLKDQAKTTLKGIVKDYPDTEAAKEALAKLTALGG